jgi:hypothetical protein
MASSGAGKYPCITTGHGSISICNSDRCSRFVRYRLQAPAAILSQSSNLLAKLPPLPVQQALTPNPFQQASQLLLLLLLLPGTAFYRAESAQGRDLAVLAAGVYRQQHGRLRVLDVMSGSGMRGARYLTQVIRNFVSSQSCLQCAHMCNVFSGTTKVADVAQRMCCQG